MSKKYAAASALVDQKKLYPVKEAVNLLTKVSTCSFDATVDVHIRINADTTQADQLVRTSVSLPHGTGKSVRIAAFVRDDSIERAKAAGAESAGNADLIKRIQEGHIDFDVAVAEPQLMKDLGKVAKVLGPKGLMPSPKSGTVTEDIAGAVESLKKGRIECKMDKFGIIHSTFGKISFGSEKLADNLTALINAIKEAKPHGIKGIYIRSITIAPTMGPGIKVEI